MSRAEINHHSYTSLFVQKKCVCVCVNLNSETYKSLYYSMIYFLKDHFIFMHTLHGGKMEV